MAVITVEKINEVHIRAYSDDFGVESELVDFFTFDYPGAKFTPMFKARLWDGKVKLYDPLCKTLYVGLISYLIKFCEKYQHDLEYKNHVLVENNIDPETIKEFTHDLNLCGRGKPITVHDYQNNAVWYSLNNNRALILSPTGSGKSLIIYSICRWHISQGRKCIVVVPTTSLVEQMYSDFVDYSTFNEWPVEEHCQKLYSGFPKHFESDVLFTTWQSAYTMPKVWFTQFDVVIGDEAHQFKSKSLSTLMERMPNAKYRIGTTGSLDNTKINSLVLEGLFGKIHKVTTTKQLIEQKKLSPLKITALLLKYPEGVRKSCNKMDYQTEIDFLVRNEKRNKFIRNLALSTTGNTLVLFQFVEKHGDVLFQMIQEKANGKKVFYIHGGTDVKSREGVRQILSEESDAIVVASFGVFSTGINIPSIENIIFASPSKSRIRNLQSIGRGLRLNSGKDHCKLFDITDDLHWKSWKNHTLKHGAERYKLYIEEEFPIKLIEADL